MEFSFDNPRPSAKDSTIGSDRLRKAIERNRAKQTKRSGQASRAGISASGGPATRRTVASQSQDVEFTTAIRKSSQRPPAPVSYRSSAPTKKTVRTTPARTTTRKRSPKTKKLIKNTNELIVKGIWVFCGILLLRLVFSSGGVRDYYSKKEILEGRKEELARIQTENQNLIKEIELLKNDPNYQKKVVRDHLGYIAHDEYLVLFPEQIN